MCSLNSSASKRIELLVPFMPDKGRNALSKLEVIDRCEGRESIRGSVWSI